MVKLVIGLSFPYALVKLLFLDVVAAGRTLCHSVQFDRPAGDNSSEAVSIVGHLGIELVFDALEDGGIAASLRSSLRSVDIDLPLSDDVDPLFSDRLVQDLSRREDDTA